MARIITMARIISRKPLEADYPRSEAKNKKVASYFDRAMSSHNVIKKKWASER